MVPGYLSTTVMRKELTKLTPRSGCRKRSELGPTGLCDTIQCFVIGADSLQAIIDDALQPHLHVACVRGAEVEGHGRDAVPPLRLTQVRVLQVAEARPQQQLPLRRLLLQCQCARIQRPPDRADPATPAPCMGY